MGHIPHLRLWAFRKYLSIWVLLSMAIGTWIGIRFPSLVDFLASMEVSHVSIPIAILLFFKMFPIMVKIDFPHLFTSGTTTAPLILTLIINWGVKPFTMVAISTLFIRYLFSPLIPSSVANQYIAGTILLGLAPCTTMVVVWSFLAKGFMRHTLVLIAINALTILVLYPPLGRTLLGLAQIPIPVVTIALSVALYVGLPMIAGYFVRTHILRCRGRYWFNQVFCHYTSKISLTALLITLTLLFALQGDIIIRRPVLIALISIPLIIQTLLIFSLTYFIAYKLNFSYKDAAPVALIGASNHFEVAIVIATTVFGLGSGAALATVVGMLIEVPLMLSLVQLCLKTRRLFRSKS